ncbi:MAG TPA: GNAT family N-acetyltransferase, partial [Reyranella sp.]|nr:GNAT family N-acetyltransferase [Reyranella sp.]
MLDVMNCYLHGFVAIPVIRTGLRRGLFHVLSQEPLGLDALSENLGARSGHLAAALRLLESLGWIDSLDGRYKATEQAEQVRFVPDNALALYPLAVEGRIGFSAQTQDLEAAIGAVCSRWNGAPALLAEFLDGTAIVPVLNALLRDGVLQAWVDGDENSGLFDGEAGELLKRLFLAKKWASETPAGVKATEIGRFVADRGLVTGTTASYAPMLLRLDELIFGKAEAVLARAKDGHETHLDRALNVVASGFQHQRFFADLEDAVVAIFDQEPISSQPRFIVDTGCGDGTLLKTLYEAIRTRTRRGGALDDHPLVMVGADFNAEALEITGRTLRDIPHRLLQVDIGDPARLARDLAAEGAGNPDEILHVRSFLDHDRPLLAAQDRAQADDRGRLPYASVSVADDGALIQPGQAVQSLVEHLGRWAAVTGRHGLAILEVHALPPAVVRDHLEVSENLHFDAYHAFSRQHLVEADTFIFAAAEAGLFPHRESARRYPHTQPFTRITFNRFERCPWRARVPTEADLPALEAIEAACWPAPLRAPRAELARRIADAPDLQGLVEHEGRVVGVVWAQRIASTETLRTARFDDLARLAIADGPVVQLLGVNVLPDYQDQGLGDRLLDFALVWYRAKAGVIAIAGITRCRDFAAQSAHSLESYIELRDEAGLPVDQILRFHGRRGARIRGLVRDYRRADSANQGHGVLIEYGSSGEAVREAAMPRHGEDDFLTLIETCVRAVREPRGIDQYSPDRALREMGLDSLDLLELRSLIGRRLGRSLEATIFFNYPTPARVAAYLAGGGPAKRMRARAVDPPDEALVRPCVQPEPRPQEGNVPIAIVGLSCRFPGHANDPDSYWELLRKGEDAIVEVPKDRWDIDSLYDPEPGKPGRIVTRYGGFLDAVEAFDAPFFRLGAREARLMDPQHRLLLEASHHALEHAGIAPSSLEGSSTGIFVGIFSHDYEQRLLAEASDLDLDAYFSTGNAAAVAAGRLAYLLGAQGPALAIDTACSSSLVAVHLACRSLRSGESDLALAAGVNLMLTPALSVVFSRAGMLSADGRCRTFDAAASGYVRSEGCGVLVLKRLDKAMADRDRVLAVIRGTAVNQDGASNGLTAPNGLAQQAVLRKALEDARLAPLDIDYVEAHGTGTSLGDPIEVAALAAVYGENRQKHEPLLVGSVKTNIGHAEAAAGMAGLIKTVLALQAAWIPAHLHYREPNPKLGLEHLPVEVTAESRDWPRHADRPRRAGVSSFGFSGTNAHVILEEAGRLPSACTVPLRAEILPLSAREPAALAALKESYVDFLARHPELAAADISLTARLGRNHFDRRLAVVGESAAEFARELAKAVPHQAVHEGRPPKIGFLFTGQGSQYAGMGRTLYANEPAFRNVIDRCDAALRGVLDRPLSEVLLGDDDDLIGQTAYTQPALFAFGAALAALWRSWGVMPAVVLGHSVGEYAAAVSAGVLSLEDGVRLIAERGRLMQALPKGGGMLSVRLDAARADEHVAPYR